MPRQSFKSDESFLEKLSLGAIGTKRVYADLESNGHRPIELERCSMSYKIWKNIKIKRFRVPDILCVHCGIKVESRAKKDLELSMSHSLTDPERAWDIGFSNNDYVAIVQCHKTGPEPIDWQADRLVQYAQVRDMRTAFANRHYTMPDAKGVEEGSEIRIIFPTIIAKSPSVIETINGTQIKVRPTGGRLAPYRLAKRGRITTDGRRYENYDINLTPIVRAEQGVCANQVIASVVPIHTNITCARRMTGEDYLLMLNSPNQQQQYTAAKALAYFRSLTIEHRLIEKLAQEEAHIYVRLELAASLARWGIQAGWDFINQCLVDTYPANRLETVIILSEIQNQAACNLLCQVLQDQTQNPDVRAGAAWGLGELNYECSLETLIRSFRTVNENIRTEAARALARLAETFRPQIVASFPNASEDERPGVAWAISHAGGFTVEELIPNLVDLDARQWIAYIVGSQRQEEFLTQIEQIRETDSELYFAITVLWKIMSSWVYNLEEY